MRIALALLLLAGCAAAPIVKQPEKVECKADTVQVYVSVPDSIIRLYEATRLGIFLHENARDSLRLLALEIEDKWLYYKERYDAAMWMKKRVYEMNKSEDEKVKKAVFGK